MVVVSVVHLEVPDFLLCRRFLVDGFRLGLRVYYYICCSCLSRLGILGHKCIPANVRQVLLRKIDEILSGFVAYRKPFWK